ncbi:MAG: hypothetical protein OHK0038_05910 [Flammeovirgaceae bacterium]
MIFRILFFLLLKAASFGFAQNLNPNLVPNGGFEQCKDTTIAYSQLENLLEWYNTSSLNNSTSTSILFGTPDHFYDIDDEGLRQARTSFRPHSGKASVGVITYSQRVRQYREYLSVKLTSPLEVGKTYVFKISLSSGALTAFGNIGTNGFGAVLSEKSLFQTKHEPLNNKPFWMLENIFFQYGWKTFVFEFIPNLPYQYLTLGNFLKDEHLKKQFYFYDIDPQAYIFIDEVSITKKEEVKIEKEEIKIDNKIIPENQIVKQENTSMQSIFLEGRKVNEQHKIGVDDTIVELWIWDDEEKDGDIISLNFNEKWILENHSLKKSKKKIQIRVEDGQTNSLILFAHNMGQIPPNTAVLLVKSGRKKQKIRLSSTLRECGAIKFVRN